MSRSELIAEFRSEIDDLIEVNVESLGREELGTLNLNPALPAIKAMRETVLELSAFPLESFSTNQIHRVGTTAKRISAAIHEVRSFDVSCNNPTNERAHILQSVEDARNEVFDALHPLFAYYQVKHAGFTETLSNATQTILEARNLMRNARIETDEIRKKTREFAADAAVAKHAAIFETEASAHENSASRWMRATVIIAVVTVGVAIGLVALPVIAPDVWLPNTTQATVQMAFSKLLLISTLTFTLIWCSRNYNAHRHNHTLNRHRANAMKTFEVFRDGAAEEHVKDAILLHAAQASFSSRTTGYDSPDKEASTVNPVVEVLGRSIPKAAESTQ